MIITHLAEIFHESGDAYSEMFENVETLKFSIVRLEPYGINQDDNFKFIDEINDLFSGDSIWLTYQSQAASYFINDENDFDELFSSIAIISKNCDMLCGKALVYVNSINKSDKQHAVV